MQIPIVEFLSHLAEDKVEAEEDGKKCRKGLKITIGLIYKINFS
jgi:hypothetical protein